MILKAIEYRYMVRSFSIDIYIGVIAIGFTAMGIWIATQFRSNYSPKSNYQFVDLNTIEALGLSEREYEVLKLMAEGHSNQEIANQLFISIHTVKTHASNLFVKLDVKRRTQAITKAKELGIIH